jgi:tRNA A37 threonylcarbamoyladenosine synthetase subunit TsaC/SUA5/YrdC
MREQERLILAGLGSGDGARLIDLVASAGLVCFPTDTVYGIGGVLRPATGERISAAKRRAADKPLQVVFPTV